ncbi:uncharacterized protein LOC143035602 [Oratosquilla oratoria]|uniref:uncharacterized protein LOC143035602 n=1 Tax=Oratosquilla oratoria TaxID=337810 RepID=UPI003F774D8E
MTPAAAPRQGKDIPSYDVLAASDTPIATYGSHHVGLDLQNVKFPWTFVVADVQQPILGYDFLQHYKMAVSTKDNCLYHATSRIPGTITNDTSSEACGDYCQLNRITKANRYPIPHSQDFHFKLHGKQVFSKVDLVRAPHQIPVAPEDIQKTAIITPIDLFE